jgi:hypothetical protein
MATHSQTELISAAVEIAQERSRLLARIRALLENGAEQEALRLMREYCGLTDEQKRTGTNPGLN